MGNTNMGDVATKMANKMAARTKAKKDSLNFDKPTHDGVLSSTQVAAQKNKNPFVQQRVTVPPPGQGPTTVTMKNGGGQFAPAPTIDALGHTILEAFPTKEEMPETREVGALGFVEGIAYVMTKEGWQNLGIAMSEPELVEMTDRRGAIAAQKAKNRYIK